MCVRVSMTFWTLFFPVIRSFCIFLYFRNYRFGVSFFFISFSTIFFLVFLFFLCFLRCWLFTRFLTIPTNVVIIIIYFWIWTKKIHEKCYLEFNAFVMIIVGVRRFFLPFFYFFGLFFLYCFHQATKCILYTILSLAKQSTPAEI